MIILTDVYCKKLFAKPVSEEDIYKTAEILRASYRKQPRKRIPEIVKDILLKIGRDTISAQDEDLIRLCYLVANHTGRAYRGKNIPKRTMYRSVFYALRDSDLFQSIHSNKDGRLVVYHLKQEKEN